MRLTAIFSFALLGLTAASLHASTETVTFSGSASGSVGASTFTSSTITFTGTFDTSNIETSGLAVTHVAVPITVTISGLGSYSISGEQFFINSNAEVAGISNGEESYMFEDSTEFSNLSLYSPFSAVFGPLGFQPGTISTSGGTLSLSDISPMSFTLTGVGATPEPGSLALLGTGLVGVAGLVRRRLVA